MRLETAKYLYDVQSAATALAGFVDGCDWAGYQHNAMLRAAVERQFEIIGEALSQLIKIAKTGVRVDFLKRSLLKVHSDPCFSW